LGGSAKLLGKALGPIFDDVGGVIKNYTEKGIANLGRVFKHMLKTLGSKLEKPGQVPPKILRDVLYHGYVCEDELSAQYVGCIEYPTGGMGVHFLNPQLIGPVPDPMRPQILLYEPVGDKFRLIGAEWFVPLATGVKEHPTLFGQRFDGPMEGHEPLMPANLNHYDLHVWLFKSNPAGLFNVVNPTVKCPKTGYTFLEHPSKTVPHR